jgi:hypothetical protein
MGGVMGGKDCVLGAADQVIPRRGIQRILEREGGIKCGCAQSTSTRKFVVFLCEDDLEETLRLKKKGGESADRLGNVMMDSWHSPDNQERKK